MVQHKLLACTKPTLKLFMKKIILLPAVLLAAFAISSCGSDGQSPADDSEKKDSVNVEAPKASFAEMCKEGNSITMTIKGYKYGMTGDFAYETSNFEVKQSSFHMLNDSTAEMKLSNYAAADLVGDRKDDQVDIVAEFHTQKGKKFDGTTFTYMDYANNASCSITMTTSKGTVYFNWVDGMPDQGGATINFAEDGKACGKFNLNVEAPGNEQIGTVRLNGAFKIGE